jgi:hypothetical protein
LKEFKVVVEQLFFCFLKGENWVIIEAKYANKNEMKCKHNLHHWENFNSL